jgi:hypothetical protein
MELSSSRESYGDSAVQENVGLLRNPKIHYREVCDILRCDDMYSVDVTFICPEAEVSMFFRNVRNDLPNNSVIKTKNRRQ